MFLPEKQELILSSNYQKVLAKNNFFIYFSLLIILCLYGFKDNPIA